MADFRWTEETEEASQLIAEGELTYQAIADKFGVAKSTVFRWTKHPEFAARVNEVIDDFRSEIRRRGLAILERRVESVNDRWRRLQVVVQERANSPEMIDVPGGSSGLLVKSLKGIGGGDDFQVVETYEVDTGLLKSILDLEKQAAQELGQWTERQELTGKDGGPLQIIKLGPSASMDDI